jgi:tRNA(Ile2) C34 agmatinyltransferase TiaS
MKYTVEGMKYKHSCRVCATPMGEANKGFDYRCARCHKKAEGWC